jgi:hypothetical protein
MNKQKIERVRSAEYPYGETLNIVIKDLQDRIANMCDALLEDEPGEQEHQFPPKGMPILVKLGDALVVRTSAGDGFYYDGGWHVSEAKARLADKTWHYLPAPESWPDDAKCWIGTSYGEYRFTALELQVGEDLYNRRVIHVQNREDT